MEVSGNGAFVIVLSLLGVCLIVFVIERYRKQQEHKDELKRHVKDEKHGL